MAPPSALQVTIPPEPYQRFCAEDSIKPGLLLPATTKYFDILTTSTQLNSLNDKKCTLIESNTEIPELQVDHYRCADGIDVDLHHNWQSSGTGLLRLWVPNAKTTELNYTTSELSSGEFLLTVTSKANGSLATNNK